ncbi:GD20105 [Drosophila simulans]|uniref:GD20105 n=1 Tax=Drosophila simulans TaxID=7240 RepID=B4NVE1_DROSI|nr:GD20105 [Drosophila simulans]
MSDSAVATPASPVAATPATVEKKVVQKKASGSAGTKAKKATATPSHPPTQQMVDASIKNLKERGGSSLLAIKNISLPPINATPKVSAIHQEVPKIGRGQWKAYPTKEKVHLDLLNCRLRQKTRSKQVKVCLQKKFKQK